MQSRIDMRPMAFFENKNVLIASGGRCRYRVALESGRFDVRVWEENICFEKAKDIETVSFPGDLDGLEQMTRWLEHRCLV